MSTLAQLRVEFLSLADDPSITAAQANIWINLYYKLLLREYPWPFIVGTNTYTVTSGTAETLFTAFTTSVTDFAKPLRVWIANSSTGDKTLLNPIRYEDRNIAGVNGYYITPDNLSFGLVPTPTNSTDVVTIDYLKSVADMVDADSPCFLSDFHSILIFKPLVAYQKQQREASDEFEFPYNEILTSMISFYKLPQEATNPVLSRGIRASKLPYNSPFR
jgi:hypothetical protein